MTVKKGVGQLNSSDEIPHVNKKGQYVITVSNGRTTFKPAIPMSTPGKLAGPGPESRDQPVAQRSAAEAVMQAREETQKHVNPAKVNKNPRKQKSFRGAETLNISQQQKTSQ